MPTNFPTGVDNFTNPTANDSLNLPSHSTQHANANDAIEAVEAYLLTGNGRAGLAHINTTAFTSQGAVNIDSIFSATYDNYRVQIDLTATSATSLLALRLRVGGVDKTSPATYNYYNLLYQTSGSAVPNAGTSDTSVTLTPTWAGGGQYITCSFDIKTPFLAGNFTQFVGNATSLTTPGFLTFGQIGGNYSTAFSADGIKVFPNSGTFSGTISVYGYRNS
jgi:hypothetical protein